MLLFELEFKGKLALKKCALDGSFVRAKRGGQRVGRTCGGSTSKRHAVVDGNGLPLAVVLSAGRCHDVTRALAAVESIQISCLRRRPRGLAADKGYDSRGFRKYLSMRGIRHSIPERKKAKRRPGRPPVYHRDLSSNRWKVERFFAWLDNFRRLATRFERLCMMHLGVIQLACVMILLRNVLK